MWKNITQFEQVLNESIRRSNGLVTEGLLFSLPLAYTELGAFETAAHQLYPNLPDQDLEVVIDRAAAVYARMFEEHLEKSHPDATHGLASTLVCGEWIRSGMPSFTLGHKVAAQMMSTRVAPSVLETLRPPWQHFCIKVPPGLLHLTTETATAQVTHVLIGHVHGSWWKFVLTDGQVVMHTCEPTLPKLLEPHNFVEELCTMETSELDVRTGRLINNLVVALLVHLEERQQDIKPVGPAKQWDRKPPNPKDLRVNCFDVRAPIRVDCREAVAQYLRGTGSAVTVRTLVMAHWKDQPHGPGRQERKRIFIEPYWRGPEGAATVVRPHAL